MITMSRDNLIRARRTYIKAKIALDGGAYITPAENAQPDPALRIASIRCGRITALGATEEQAQADFMRQAFTPAPQSARRP